MKLRTVSILVASTLFAGLAQAQNVTSNYNAQVTAVVS